jgi:DNA invertase Pin-like site-specific DNA recombinase
MKVALYARVSMEEEDKNEKRYQEPENQLEPLRVWAKSMNWEVVAEYVDRASGGDHNRPNFQKMMNDAMLQKFKLVLVWKLDRFSREGIRHTLAYIQRLRNRGCALKSMTESWLDTSEDNPMGEFIVAIFSWVAAEEQKKISDRTKLGIQRRRNLGVWKGGRPKKRVAPLRIEEEHSEEKGSFNEVSNG